MLNWAKASLEEVVDSFIDYRGKTPKKTDFGVPLVTAKIVKGGRILEPNEFIAPEDYDSWMTRGLPQVNDVVLTTEAPLGEVGLIKNDKIALAQRIITLRGKPEKLFNPFLKYYLQSKIGQHELKSRASGTTVFGIKGSVLKKVPIYLPPLPEQRAIASVLSSLDEKIDLLHRQNTTLEVLAETLFRQWFVEEAGEDWEEGILGDIIEFNPPYTIIRDKPTPYLEMSNVSGSKFNPDSWYKREYKSGMRFKNDDTLLARITPCLENGKTCFVAFLEEGEIGWGSTEYIVMKMKESFHPFTSYLIAKNKEFRDYAISTMSGSSGRQRAKAEVVKKFNVHLPPKKIVDNLNAQLNEILPKLINNSKQIRTLEKLRDTLLPKLMSGEVSIQKN